MKLEEQRIAIAEACGWERATKGDWQAPDGMRHQNWAGHLACPDYPTDLNAMHEAEKNFTEDQHLLYATHLARLCIDEVHANRTRYHLATAAQRAEAFLRTLNLWKDDDN